jgi:hypothetical protein
VQGAAVALKLAGDLRLRAHPGRQEELDQLPGPVQRGHVLGSGQRLQELLRVGPQVRVGHAVGGGEVSAVQHQAGEGMVELRDHAEQPLMHRAVRGRAVREAGRHGVPPRPEELPQNAVHHPDRQLKGLPAGHLLAEVEGDGEGRELVALGHPQPHRLVVGVLVADQQLKGAADVRLLAEDQAERAEVGKLAQFRQAHAEVLVAGFRRGILQHRDDGRRRYPGVLERQPRRVQSVGAHEAHRVDPEALAEFDVPVEGGVAGAGLHVGMLRAGREDGCVPKR